MSLSVIRWGIVVEGEGEVEAVPILLRRLEHERYLGVARFEIARPVRAKRNKLVRTKKQQLVYDDDEIERAVGLAAISIGQAGAILFLMDAEEDPACRIGPEVLHRNQATHAHLEHSVVFAVKEFEAWFLSALPSLAGINGIPRDVRVWDRPEEVLGAKGALTRIMGRSYSETVDQPKFTRQFDLDQARAASSSFDKLCRDVDTIVMSAASR